MRQDFDLTSCDETPPTDQDQRVTSLLDLAWPVRTERLVLRPATLHDTEPTWQIRRLESVSRWLTRAPHSFDIYRADFQDPASLEKSLVIELDTQIIGDLMVDVGDAWARAEVADKARRVQADLGWVIHPTSAAVDLPPKPSRRCSGSASSSSGCAGSPQNASRQTNPRGG
jgi:hypothetical protein